MYDFCINGGGMVGAALALGLAQQRFKVAVIEPTLPREFNAEDGPDLRVSAISASSVSLLRKLGAWQYIESMRYKAYTGLSVWDAPQHRTDFTSQSVGEKQLGYFVENRLIQLGCHKALEACSQVDIYSGQSVKHIEESDSGEENKQVSVVLCNGEGVSATWLIGADGAHSQVRQAVGIGSSGWQYQQQAMGITILLDKPVKPITWQQFTPQGPRAFLPMFGNYGSLVWYDNPDVLANLSKLNNGQLSSEIMNAFPLELTADGNGFTIVDKAVFPLTRAHASEYIRGNCVLIGDAAHTINPLAGQGVNLGFKDVEALLAVSAQYTALSSHELLSSNGFRAALKANYEAPRRRDNALMMSAMDGFYILFSNDLAPIKWFRNQLLSVAQRIEPAKREVLKYAIGLR